MHKDLDDVAWHLGEARAILGPEPVTEDFVSIGASVEPAPEAPVELVAETVANPSSAEQVMPESAVKKPQKPPQLVTNLGR